MFPKLTNPKLALIIPAINEEESIGKTLNGIPKDLFSQIIVVDNNSTDNTAEEAKNAGASVIFEPIEGYGKACLSGIAALEQDISIVVFMDGDTADDPKDLPKLLTPITENAADFTLGSRIRGVREKGAMTSAQVFGGWLASFLMKLFWGFQYSDLGPFRAIRHDALKHLEMRDTNYGWTVEMQIKAIQHKLRIKEIPVNYRKRIGVSKISGTIKGVFLAGFKIIYTIFKYSIRS